MCVHGKTTKRSKEIITIDGNCTNRSIWSFKHDAVGTEPKESWCSWIVRCTGLGEDDQMLGRSWAGNSLQALVKNGHFLLCAVGAAEGVYWGGGGR